MIWRITHETAYTYAQAVSGCWNLLHLRPRDTPVQRCRATALAITPRPAVIADRYDFFGNAITFCTFREVHEALSLVATSDVETFAAPALLSAAADVSWESAREALRTPHDAATLACWQFTIDSPLATVTSDVRDFAAASLVPGRPLLEAVVDLCRRIHVEFTYAPGATTVSTAPEDTLVQRRGVCQDFAHLAIAGLRAHGLAARYVSGYLATGRLAGGQPLLGGDASHAWVGVWSPALGWVDVDPTNDVLAGERHVTVAWGRDYGDVSPVKGVVLGGGAHSVDVGVEVAPLDPGPPLGG